MLARHVKIGKHYLLHDTAGAAVFPVKVLGKYRKRVTRMSGKGGMPSVWYVEKTYFRILDSQGRVFESIRASDLSPVA